MKKLRNTYTFAAFPILVFLLAALCAGCGSSKFHSNFSSVKAADHWTVTDNGLTYDGEERDSQFLSGDFLAAQDFRYATDVSFTDVKRGSAALIFQYGGENGDCYAARVNARTNKAGLFKMERGMEIALGGEVVVEDKTDYHLQVSMVGTHIDFFVDNVLICSTGDYVANPDIGQNDVLLSGELGLYGGEGELSFQNTFYTVYGEGESPVLTELSIEPNSGSVEAEGNMLANGWYAYQQYVSNDCGEIKVNYAAPEGVDVTVLSGATGEAVTGAVPLSEGENRFQILTSIAGEDGTPAYQASYRLNILRRGEGYYQEPYRGQYHYSVKEGWANDPNGLVKLGDTWHMYYQFNPESTDWGNMQWMHTTSKDLIHWEDQGIVLRPNEYGTMFNGCIVTDEDNVSGLFPAGEGGLVAIITANGNGQRMIAAYSQDGQNWTYYRGTDENGVPNGDDVLIDWREDEVLSSAFRDPQIFRYQDTYFMTLAGGKLRIYSSANLLDWKLESSYGDRPNNSTGLTIDTECPGLYRLPIEGEDGWKWIFSYGGRRYQVGEFTQVDGKWEFIPDAGYEEPAPMNFGNDSYAALPYYIDPSFNEDTQDRVIVCNWMNSWDYCTLVDDFSNNTRFNGTYNLNLEVSLVRDQGGRLVLKQKPVDEYGRDVFPAVNVKVQRDFAVAAEETQKLEGYEGRSYLLDVTITPDSSAVQAGVMVCTGEAQGTSITYDFATDTLTVNRGGSNGPFSSNSFSQVVTEKRENGAVTLHIYVDRASVEVFSGGYTAACGLQIFPAETDTGIALTSSGGGSSFAVTVTEANSIWKVE